jgi:glycerophosphoryl diester phosphodiesterase
VEWADWGDGVLDTRRKTRGKVSIVGHRGAAGCAPENTLAAFGEGLAQGADIIELDVQLSADGHVVAFHDDRLDRTTDGQGRVSAKTLAELKALDAGSWFDPRFAGESIPTLEDVLTWARERVPLFVELKYEGHVDPGDLPLQAGKTLDDAVVAQIVAHAMLDQVMVISFNHRALRRVKARAPGLATGALYGLPVADPVALAREAGADAVMPLCHIVTAQDVAACHAAGLAVNVWGALADYAALIAAGVDCVNADHPAQVRHDFF